MFSDVTCPQKSEEKGVDPESSLGFKIPNHSQSLKHGEKGKGELHSVKCDDLFNS